MLLHLGVSYDRRAVSKASSAWLVVHDRSGRLNQLFVVSLCISCS